MRVDLLATALALALASLKRRLVPLQVAEEAAEDITDTTGTSGIGALGIGITSTDSTTSEATQI